MQWNSDTPAITWLELAVSSRWKKDGTAVAAVHNMGKDGNCFGVSLDRQWLCGTDGALTVFDSVAAATRFLHLLKVDQITPGRPCEMVEKPPVQCYRLGPAGLTVCTKCAGELPKVMNASVQQLAMPGVAKATLAFNSTKDAYHGEHYAL